MSSAVGKNVYRKRRSPARRAKTLCLYAVLCLFGLLYLYPLLWAVSASLKPLDEIYAVPPTLRIAEPQWENYPNALMKLPFHKFFLNTLLIAAPSVIGTIFSSALAGYAFARLKWKGRDVCFVLMLTTMMLPVQVLLIPKYLLFQALGWIDTFKPLIVPAWLGGNAFGIFLFRQFFKSLPGELGEAASIDGASSWQTFWTIYFPLTKPVTATLCVLTLVSVWQDFMGPLIYLSDYNKFPLSLGLLMYKSIEGSWVNLIAAASLVTLIPLVIIFFAFQKYLVRGMTLTTDKE